MDTDGKIKYPYAPYYGIRLLTQNWLLSNGSHELYPTAVTAADGSRLTTVTAYAVRRPDGLWSVLFINKDPNRTYRTELRFRPTDRKLIQTTEAPLELFQYSSAQYMLNSDRSNPVPTKNDPPVSTILNRENADSIELPPYSLTVLRGRLK